MRISDDFVVQSSGGETIIVPVGSNSFIGMVRGNKTLGAILEMLKDETTEEQIVASMKKRFDAPEEAIRRDVVKAIAKLREIGAIDG